MGTPTVRGVLSKLCWVLLVLIHLPGILATWRALALEAFDPASLARFAGLILSTVYFVLKAADLPVLRLSPGWRSAVSLVLMVALLHVGAIDRTISAGLDRDLEVVSALLIFGALGLGGICVRRIIRFLSRGVLALQAAGRSIRPTFRWAGTWSACFLVMPQVCTVPVSAPRGPPAWY